MDTSLLLELIPGLVIFRISDLELCANVKDVQLIRALEECELVSRDLSGDNLYLTLNKINIPIIDIARHLGLVNENVKKRSMILIINHHGENDNIEKTFGILADEVKEIVSIDKSDNRFLLKFIPASDNSFLSGVIVWKKRKLLLPNFSKITSLLNLKVNNVL